MVLPQSVFLKTFVQMQKALQDVELEIQRRGQAVERRWLSAAHQETTFGK